MITEKESSSNVLACKCTKECFQKLLWFVRAVVALAVLGLVLLQPTLAKADLVINLRKSGSGVEMVYSGSITGVPTLMSPTPRATGPTVGPTNLSTGYFDTAATYRFQISGPTTAFANTTSSAALPSSASPATNVFFLKLTSQTFELRSNSGSAALSGRVYFPNFDLSNLGSQDGRSWVVLGTTGGLGGSNDRIELLVEPTISTMTPASGSVQGGVSVVISGTSFTGATSVEFGGVPASSFTVDSESQITATAPAGVAGLIDVSVTTAGGTALSVGGFNYIPPPVIASITPTIGSTAGGAVVDIVGTGFSGATAVSFGGIAASSFSVVSPTQITATTPSSAAGVVNVSVTAAGGAVTLANGYTFSDSRPNVTLSGPDGPVTGSFALTVTFSEAVSGFDLTDVTALNASLSNLTELSAGTVYTMQVTPDSGDYSTVSVDAYVVQNAIGNFNTASNTYTVGHDNVYPTVSITGPTERASGPFIIDITFSEAVVGFDPTKLSVSNASLSNFSEVTDGISFTVLVTPVMGQTVTAKVEAQAVTDSAGNPNESSNLFSVESGSVQSAFGMYRDEVKRIIQDQAVNRLTTSLAYNNRMMQDVRSRFVSLSSPFADKQAGLAHDGFAELPFDVSGTMNVEGGLNGIVAASSGEFVGQTGLLNGVNWRVSGNFDVLIDGDQSMAAVDGRVVREHLVGSNILWGTFGGAQFSDGEIEDTFHGRETTWQFYVGSYALASISDYLIADGYASLGYGLSNLSMDRDDLSLESSYDNFTWQIGGSLTGLIEMPVFDLRPNVSLSYGNSNLGEVDFVAVAYGLTQDLSLDADYVAMGVLRLTPEVLVALNSADETENQLVLSLLPSFICQQTIANGTETNCGWGIGAELIQTAAGNAGQLNGKIDFETVGGVTNLGGRIGYSVRF